jgi:hypothetical protein
MLNSMMLIHPFYLHLQKMTPVLKHRAQIDCKQLLVLQMFINLRQPLIVAMDQQKPSLLRRFLLDLSLTSLTALIMSLIRNRGAKYLTLPANTPITQNQLSIPLLIPPLIQHLMLIQSCQRRRKSPSLSTSMMLMPRQRV